jgi:hypothetical protein
MEKAKYHSPKKLRVKEKWYKMNFIKIKTFVF